MWAYLSRSRPLTLMSWRLSASAPGCEARLPLVPVWVLGEWRLGPGLLLAGGGAIEAREAPGDGEEADPDQSLEPELELEPLTLPTPETRLSETISRGDSFSLVASLDSLLDSL